MLPNFTVVICGAILTVLMLAVAGSGLIEPQTRTRVGAMPEIGRPMMQRMITEPAARGQFAALEMARRAEELMRLRDLAPALAEPAPAAEHDDPAQPAEDTAAPAPALPADTAAASTAGTETPPEAAAEAVLAAVAEAKPAAAADAAPATETASAEAREAAPEDAAPAAVAEAAPTEPRGTDGAPASVDIRLAAEPAGEASPAAPPVAPPAAAPERFAAAPPLEPAVEEPGAPPTEPPVAALQQLALAEPDAVPAPESTAKLAARTGEPEEPAPVRRLAPRIVPTLTRRLLLQARLAPATPRITPLVRRVHARARPGGAKPEMAVVAKRSVRHVIRQAAHRAHHPYGTAVSPYATYGVTSGAQYR